MNVRSAIALALLTSWAVCLPSWGQPAPPAPARLQGPDSTEVPFAWRVTRDAIESAGVHRLSDVFTSTGRVSGYAADGFGHTFSVGALGTPGRPTWKFRLDGIPLLIGAFWGPHPELVPVSPGTVESVTVQSVASAGAGGLAGGSIDLRTLRPPEGLSFAGSVSVGNQIGDPGPYRYTEYASPNVDRIGPVYGVRGGLRTGDWDLSIGVRGDEVHLTDPSLAERVWILYRGDRNPRILVSNPFMLLGRETGRSRHRILASASSVQDLRFTPEIGMEVPAKQELWTLAAAGHAPASPSLALTYAVLIQRADVVERIREQQTAFDLSETRYEGEIGLKSTGRGGSFDMAAGMRYRSMRMNPRVTDSETLIPFVRVEASWKAVPAWSHSVSVEAVVSDEDAAESARIGLSGAWTQRIGVGSITLDLGASLLTRLPEGEGAPWYWLARGWDYPGDGMGRTTTAPAFTDSRTLALDAELTIRDHRGGRLAIAVFGRRFQGLTLPHIRAAPDSAFVVRYRTTVAVQTGIEGRVYGGRVQIEQPLGSRTILRAVLTAVRPVSGHDQTFWQHWSRHPRYESRYEIAATPVERATVRLSVHYRSRTTWPDLLGLPLPDGTVPVETVPATLQVDMTISKALFGPRMTAFLTLANLTNRPIRTHPLGPIDRMALHVGVSARFSASTP